jgi:NADH:ubiquinone oxidoreductase subunit B-like Fe-S oxidoreductase
MHLRTYENVDEGITTVPVDLYIQAIDGYREARDKIMELQEELQRANGQISLMNSLLKESENKKDGS